MNDEFLETLLRQYTNNLHEIRSECTHRDSFDAETFVARAAKEWKAAKHDGISADHFHELLQDVAPDHASQVQLK